jgi:hypothetical protein
MMIKGTAAKLTLWICDVVVVVVLWFYAPRLRLLYLYIVCGVVVVVKFKILSVCPLQNNFVQIY